MKNELLPLTTLRGLAALWVFAFHVRHEFKAFLPALYRDAKPAFMTGYLGVDIFFALSGFVIALNYSEDLRRFDAGKYGVFMVKRLARIYPAYLFALLVLVGFYIALAVQDHPIASSARFRPGALLPQALMVHAWTFPVDGRWSVVSWSVSAEWLAYLLFPGILMACRVATRPALAWLGIAGVCASFPAFLEVVPHRHAMDVGVFRGLWGFCCGVLLYQATRDLERRHTLPGWLGIAALLAAPAGYRWASSGGDAVRYAPLLATTVVALLAVSASTGTFRWFSSRPLLWLGRVSYAFYLMQEITLLVARIWFPVQQWRERVHVVTYLSAMVVATLIMAWLVHCLIELPCRAFIVRRTVARDPSRD